MRNLYISESFSSDRLYFSEAGEESESTLVVSQVSGRPFINPAGTTLLVPFRSGSLVRAGGEFCRFAGRHPEAQLSRLELDATVEETAVEGARPPGPEKLAWNGHQS